MARLPYLDAQDLAPADRDLLARPINLFRLMVHSPGGARAFNALGRYIRFDSPLDPRLREQAMGRPWAELLGALRRLGVQIVVVTAKSTALAAVCLDVAGLPYDDVVGWVHGLEKGEALRAAAAIE